MERRPARRPVACSLQELGLSGKGRASSLEAIQAICTVLLAEAGRCAFQAAWLVEILEQRRKPSAPLPSSLLSLEKGLPVQLRQTQPVLL